MRLEIQRDERDRADGVVVAEKHSYPFDVYEVGDETAARWLEADAAWMAVRKEMDAFTRSQKSEGQVSRDAEIDRGYGL